MRIPLAVAGNAPRGFLDEFGYLHFDGGWRVEWWVGGEDHWHVPASAASRRQRVVGNTPVVETVIRVPGGDVAWRAAAAATGEGGAVTIEFENTATIPVALGIALVTPSDLAAPLGRPALHFTAPARSVAADVGVELLVHPVSHGSTWRASIGPTPPGSLPPVEAIVRGWQAFTRQGASVSTGDASMDDALATARTSLLLHAASLRAPRDRLRGAAVANALTYLGYEDEAEALRVASRLRPQRRGLPLVSDPHAAYNPDALRMLEDPVAAAATVSAIRRALVDDTQRGVIDVLPSANASLRGRSVDIANLPTNFGPVSFALRWHGEKPALLWEAPPARRRRARITLRASALDPDWSTTDQAGEALLRG
ncbi:MAG: hypothetical protein QOK28_3506 [Actinomycetota bacterium]